MDEFTSIAIWLLIAIMSVNVTITWFANQPTFTNPDLGLMIPTITGNSLFVTNDVNALKNNYYLPTQDNCSTLDSSLASFGPCVFQVAGNIFKPVTDAINLLGGFVQDLWNFSFAWAAVIDTTFSMAPGGDLFASILKIIIGGIEIAAIVVITLRVVAIIRGVSGGI